MNKVLHKYFLIFALLLYAGSHVNAAGQQSDTLISYLATKVDAVYDKYVKLVKLHALKKRKAILGSYFEPKNEEERLLLPELKKLKPLPEPKE